MASVRTKWQTILTWSDVFREGYERNRTEKKKKCLHISVNSDILWGNQEIGLWNRDLDPWNAALQLSNRINKGWVQQILSILKKPPWWDSNVTDSLVVGFVAIEIESISRKGIVALVACSQLWKTRNPRCQIVRIQVRRASAGRFSTFRKRNKNEQRMRGKIRGRMNVIMGTIACNEECGWLSPKPRQAETRVP